MFVVWTRSYCIDFICQKLQRELFLCKLEVHVSDVKLRQRLSIEIVLSK